MATHLTSTTPFHGSAAKYHLASLGNHLVRISKKTMWRGKELIVTPSREKFTTAVACGLADGGDCGLEGAGTSGANLVSAVQAIVSSKTTADSWTDGHKSGFMYWSRGFTDVFSTILARKSYDPYYVFQSASEPTDENLNKSMGVFGCWQALYFDIKAFPIYEASSFELYFRFYNPSWLLFAWQHALAPQDSARQVESWEYAPSDAATVSLKAYGELPGLSDFNAAQPTDRQDVSFPRMANKGYLGVVPDDHCGFYDPLSCFDLPVSSWKRKLLENAILGLPVYRTGEDGFEDYFVDVQASAQTIGSIMAIEAEGKSGFWLVAGPVVRNAYRDSTNRLKPGINSVMHFSRIELRIVCSLNSFNG